MQVMINGISVILLKFRQCFSRKAAFNTNKERLVHIVTRAKSNVAGYQYAPSKTVGRGRQAQKVWKEAEANESV